jgi:hypothetical protein
MQKQKIFMKKSVSVFLPRMKKKVFSGNFPRLCPRDGKDKTCGAALHTSVNHFFEITNNGHDIFCTF